MFSKSTLLAGLVAAIFGVSAPFVSMAQEAGEHLTMVRMRVQTISTAAANGSADDIDVRLSSRDAERVESKSVTTYPTTSQCQTRGDGVKQCLESAVELGTSVSVVAAVKADGAHIALNLTRSNMSFDTASAPGDGSLSLPVVSTQRLQQSFVLRQGESALVAMSPRSSVKLTLESIERDSSQAK